MAIGLIPRITHLDFNDAIDELRRRIAVLFRNLFDINTIVVTASKTASRAENVLLCNATSGSLTITLPDALLVKESTIVVKKTDASVNTVTIDGFGAQTIDGAATVVLSTQYHFRVIISDGLNWHIIGS